MSKRTLVIFIVLLLIIAGFVWFYSRKNDTAATPVLSVSALNQTKNKDATSAPATSQDVIVYTLTAENQSDKVISGYIMEVNISDVTKSASLLDAQGASYNSATNSLVWTPLDIPANSSITKQFSVKVNPVATGSIAPDLKVKFNNEVTVIVSTPTVAGNTTPTPPTGYIAPTTGPSPMLAVFLAIAATIGFLAIRKRQLAK